MHAYVRRNRRLSPLAHPRKYKTDFRAQETSEATYILFYIFRSADAKEQTRLKPKRIAQKAGSIIKASQPHTIINFAAKNVMIGVN